jgi:hypothetical protein
VLAAKCSGRKNANGKFPSSTCHFLILDGIMSLILNESSMRHCNITTAKGLKRENEILKFQLPISPLKTNTANT